MNNHGFLFGKSFQLPPLYVKFVVMMIKDCILKIIQSNPTTKPTIWHFDKIQQLNIESYLRMYIVREDKFLSVLAYIKKNYIE